MPVLDTWHLTCLPRLLQHHGFRSAVARGALVTLRTIFAPVGTDRAFQGSTGSISRRLKVDLDTRVVIVAVSLQQDPVVLAVLFCDRAIAGTDYLVIGNRAAKVSRLGAVRAIDLNVELADARTSIATRRQRTTTEIYARNGQRSDHEGEASLNRHHACVVKSTVVTPCDIPPESSTLAAHPPGLREPGRSTLFQHAKTSETFCSDRSRRWRPSPWECRLVRSMHPNSVSRGYRNARIILKTRHFIRANPSRHFDRASR